MDSPDWSHMIRALIEQKGYTEQSLADYVGTSQATINFLKNRTIKEPKYITGSKLVNLCAINGVSIKEKTPAVQS
ncbi:MULTISPECIES: helix-turn-helix transcriptional regulator [unclassified Acinetobacter]|uniref:helix-turn-helix domain-containing protein n=1 Tax=unclassified Acinetobacter TaxID=196816 RepID=UPI0015D3C53B|nr:MULTISPECIES: helix-turn-helix transcriptional regulator [unclassified Acinetobacter]